MLKSVSVEDGTVKVHILLWYLMNKAPLVCRIFFFPQKNENPSFILRK